MRFIVEGKPQGKQRARTFFNHNTGRMQSITPEQTKSYEELIRWSYKVSGGKYLGEKPIELSIRAYYSIPQAFSRAKKEQALQGQIRPMTRPDIDNCAKVVMDALNGVAIYDDKQILGLNISKWYGDRARLEITINILQNS